MRLIPSPPLKPLEIELLQKVGAGEVEQARALIQQGTSPNVRDDRMGGETPLHISAKQANLAMTQMLLAEGAEILENHEKTTPIEWAVGWMQDSVAIMNTLLDHLRGDPAEAMREALITASARGIHDIMEILLARGADPFACAKEGRYRAVDHMISSEDDLRTVEILLKHRGPKALAMEKELGWTLLFMAAAAAAPKTTQRLLDYGFTATARCPVGATPMQAIGRAAPNTLIKHTQNDEERAEMMCRRKDSITQTLNTLLQAGGRIDDYDHYGNGVLHEAAGRADTMAVAVFLEAGADLNAKGLNEKTPLHSAALLSTCLKERLECVHLMLENGSDPSWRDADGKTAGDYAEELMWSEGATLLKTAVAQQVLEQQVAQPRPMLKARL